MGKVYLAQLPDQSGWLAVKMLRPDLAQDETAASRFIDIAEAMSRIQHDNVAKVFEARRLGPDRVVMAMEYLEGRDLSEVIAEAGELDPSDVVRIGKQVSAGLAEAHRAGIAHLDLKPENVFLVKDTEGEEQVKLLDFGIGELRSAAEAGAARIDASGLPVGTPEYWSPEQAVGGSLDPRSDVYSLGVMLYEALAGKTPFYSHSVSDMVEAHQRTAPKTIDRPTGRAPVPRKLEKLVLRCLAKDPAQRFGSADELARELDALAQPVLRASRPGPPSTGEPVKRKSGVSDLGGTRPSSRFGRTCPKCGLHYAPEVEFCPKDGERLPEVHTLPTGDDDPIVGEQIGSYRILRMIGEGGMGRVYLAEHTLLGRKVALKMLLSEYSKDKNAVSRFFHEARAVNQIGHANIVDITDFVEHVGGDNYYVMEFLDGMSLHSEMKKHKQIQAERIVNIGRQVSSALAASHKAGIVHRDLKPENIFLIENLDRPDFVKLLDFGIAKLVNASGDSLQKTRAGAVMGTPEYMSPEQASAEEVDGRTDIYSLGVILYEMACGEVPIKASSFSQMLFKLLNTEPRRPSTIQGLRLPIPAGLEAVVLKCLAKDPGERFQSMDELGAALEQAIDADPAAFGSLDDDEVAPKRRTGLYAVLAALVAAAAVGGYLAYDRFAGSGTGATPAPTEPTAPVVAPAEVTPKPEAKTKPATPAKVEITFDSKPHGAEVFRNGDEVALGTTPFTASLASSDEAVPFTFRRKGYQDHLEEIVLSEAQKISAKLRKKKRAARKGRAGKRGKGKSKIKKGGTVDPFAL